MARRSGSTIQEELYSTPDEPAREELDDARLLDLDAEKESPFLRAQKRVPARRGPLPKKTAAKLLWAFTAIIVAGLGAIGAAVLYHYGEHSWRFRLQSSDDIEMTGLVNVTRGQVMEVMGGDMGRNVFYIPLDQRKKQLEQIPWVESASVMRFAPNRIRIQIHERTPVAFARLGPKILLVDAGGVLMDLSTKKKYSFPVIIGMNSGEPLSTRAPRMRIYNELVRDLDSAGSHYSQVLSEVDLTDPEDVKVLTNDADGEVLVHLGSSNYLDRYKVYVAHLREWRQQFAKLESVDLRYDRQIVVNPDLRGTARQPAISAASAKAAMAAGVKPAALATRVSVSFPRSTSTAQTLAQKTRKDGALSSLPVSPQKPRKESLVASLTPGTKQSVVATSKPTMKGSAKVSRWHKRWIPKKHAVATASPSATVSVKAQSSTAMQKPSPAITKGQQNP
jgi:cell division protein FtsQ